MAVSVKCPSLVLHRLSDRLRLASVSLSSSSSSSSILSRLVHKNSIRLVISLSSSSTSSSSSLSVLCGSRNKNNRILSPPSLSLLSSVVRGSTNKNDRTVSSLSTMSLSSSSSSSSSSTCEPTTDKSSLLQMQPDLDLENRLSDASLGDLRRNLTVRGLHLDLDQLVASYRQWRHLNDQKVRLETERTVIAKSMASLVKGKKTEEGQREKEQLTERGKTVKEQLRDLMPVWQRADQGLTTQALRLPTPLHHSTPETEDEMLETSEGTLGQAGIASHMEFGERLGLLKFSPVGHGAVYLLGQTAQVETTLLHSAATRLSAQSYLPMSAPEIFRSAVLEGCGMEPENSFSLQTREEERETNAYFLKGNSLLSYAALLTRIQVRKESLPLKYYSIGRHYSPPQDDGLPGLYGSVQSSRVTVFGACGAGEITGLHDDMLKASWDMVHQLGLPSRRVLICARKLCPSESLRTEVQIWAPSVQQYVTMAHASLHNDYVSRRLSTKLPSADFLHMVSGVAMNAPVVIASLLEHSYTQGQVKLKDLRV